MDSIPADQWIGEYARWLRVHEAKLGDVAASAAAAKRNANRDAPASTLSSTFWNVVSLGTANTATTSPARSSSNTSSAASALAARPMLLRQNPHNLYYLLIRFEALGLPVGSLDTKIPIAARPTSYFSFVAATAADKNRDDTMSMSSMRSRISVVSSSFSSSLSWFGTSTNKPDPSRDVKYIYSCFTKIPSLRLGPIPARKLIQDFEDCPGQSAVPLDVFKNLQMLELDDVDPRTLIGWDRVCIQLRSLTCKKSNIEDLTDLLVDLVVVDTKRRRGEKVDLRRLRRAPPAADAQEDLSASNTTASNTDAEDNLTEVSIEPSASASTSDAPTTTTTRDATPTLPKDLPSLAWHFLRYLNLSSNNLTFVPVEPLFCLSGLTNLDLSSNLLNVVPPALSHLPSLTSLNISDNLIDSVLGIYDTLPAIRVLNLAKNRLESLCGLERLYTLQRIDLRGNAIYEAGEVGRLAPLPAIAEVWVKDNPLVEELIDYRVDCFVEFAQEGRLVILDGEAAGFFERQRIAERVPNAAELFAQGSSSRGGSQLVGSPSRNATVRGGKKATGEAAEENEAQLAKDVATTSRSATVVKNVRHRATPRAANTENARGRSELLNLPSGSKNSSQTDATKTADSRSRSTSRTRDGSRLQSGGASSAQVGGGRRRNQRVVELDTSPQKQSMPKRERTLTESDRIKQAALSGNKSAAMETPEPSTIKKAAAEQGEAATTPSPSPLKNGKMTWSRKAGASAAQLAAAESDPSLSGTDAAEKKQVSSGGADADALAAHAGMLFALPPGLAGPTSPSREGKQRTLTSRRHPIDSSTLGRKSAAARPMASDLFATSNSNGAASAAEAGRDDGSSGPTTATGRGEEEASAQDTPAALARQRIARPRQGSSAALARRSRVTTSMYDPDLYAAAAESSSLLKGVSEEDDSKSQPAARLVPSNAAALPNANETEAVDSQANTGSSTSATVTTTTTTTTTTTASERSEAFRRRIEALKSEVGDDWLRLLARGGGTAGDRNSAAMLTLSDVNNEVAASHGGTEVKGEVTRVVRPKKSKKKMRTNHNNHMMDGEGSSSRRTSVDRTEETGSSRRREARIT